MDLIMMHSSINYYNAVIEFRRRNLQGWSSGSISKPRCPIFTLEIIQMGT